MDSKPHISVVVPVYGCAPCLDPLVNRLKTALSPISENFELLLVDDRSPDGAWEVIRQLAAGDARVKGLRLSRNFGQHYAISAGLDHAKGEWVVVMDCDLQDLPEEIPKLYKKALEGHDIVYAISAFRGSRDPLSNLIRRIYRRLYDLLSNRPIKAANLSFMILSGKVRDSLVQYREFSRHISSLVREVGFRITGIEVEHKDRSIGKSSYTLMKKLDLAFVGIMAYSYSLLKISFFVGMAFSLFAFLFGFYIVVKTLMGGVGLPGWSSLITVILFSSGLILTFMGVIGMYIEKIFLEVKRRPLYVVEEDVNV